MSLIGTINQDFWAGKRVLVTGHTGFKGSWLSLWLHMMKAEVFGFALTPAIEPALFNEAKVGDRVTSIIGDVRNFDAVQNAVAVSKPDIIIHMAAQPLVRYSYLHPVETYSTNVMGTVHLLEATRQLGVTKVVINVTTDKCYENKEWLWGYREDDSIGGHDPYSSSKGCTELVTSAYRRSFYKEASIALASVRAGNVIGGGDWSTDRLIPDILRAFERNQSVLIRNPNSIRPWQHVLAPLSGYLMLAESLFENAKTFAGAWNFGPNDEDAKSVHWIVEKMIKRWGGEAQWELDGKLHPHEANYLKLDNSKAKSLLGWRPLWGLDTALEQTIDWHKTWINGADVRAVCERQIKDYEVSVFNAGL